MSSQPEFMSALERLLTGNARAELGASADRLSVAAADLDGIAESAAKLGDRLHQLVDRVRTWDELQALLVEVELDIEHLTWHWNSLRQTLGITDGDESVDPGKV